MEDINIEVVFREELDIIVESFGELSQEGAKEALRTCQELLGHVSKGNQREIANAFKLDEKVVKTIVKFMPSIKESVVEYEVVLCTGKRCHANGSMDVIRAVKDSLDLKLDECSEDGRIRLTTQNCFKKCHLGPNIMVNGEFHHKMDREKAKKLMEEIQSK